MLRRRPILARYSKRELLILRWMREGAWLQMPGPTVTLHPLVGRDGLPIVQVQQRLVQRLVDARRIVWRDDLQAYVITETGLELLHLVSRAA